VSDAAREKLIHMRFDMFCELGLPDFSGASEHEMLRQTIEEIALGDEAGFDGAWLVEHHFYAPYSHCSAPEVMFGALTQRTRRMRLGSAVVVLPIKHPVAVAERFAMLDVLSGGRIDVGVGRGFSPVEYKVFGGSPDESRARLMEGIEVMRRSWDAGPFSFDGRFWSFPEIDVVPKPVQRPHPRLWLAASSLDSFPMAADEGLGVLAGPFKPVSMIAEDRERFVSRCHELGRDPGELGFAITAGVVVLDDHDRAREIAARNVRWFYEQLLRVTRRALESEAPRYRDFLEEPDIIRDLVGGQPSLETLDAAGMVIAGNPEYVIERFRTIESAGIDHVLCRLTAGRVPHRDVLRSIELFGEKVMPAFRGVASPV
jgi:alkanesulfonate monooxygenase SsuD/methylene tetrahydromethanopterin reductase-like flavin-dependent oxidoreductase (luciferase family)